MKIINVEMLSIEYSDCWMHDVRAFATNTSNKSALLIRFHQFSLLVLYFEANVDDDDYVKRKIKKKTSW